MKWIIAIVASLMPVLANASNCKLSPVFLQFEMQEKHYQTAQKILGDRYAENPNDANYLIKVNFETPIGIGGWVTSIGQVSNFQDGQDLVVKGRGPVISVPLSPIIPAVIPIVSMKNIAFRHMLKKIPSCEELHQYFTNRKP